MNERPPPPKPNAQPNPIGLLTLPSRPVFNIFKSAVSIIIALIGFFLLFAFPVGIIYVSVIHRNNCPASPKIPVFLAGFGALFIYRIILYSLDLWAVPRCYRTMWPDLVYTLSILTLIFMVLTSTIGIYLVAREIWPNFMDTTASNYCHPGIYIVATVTFVDVIFGSIFWCTCFCCFFPRNGKEKPALPTDNQNIA